MRAEGVGRAKIAKLAIFAFYWLLEGKFLKFRAESANFGPFTGLAP